MDPARFADDLSAIPAALRRLADALSGGLPGLERARTLLAPPRLRVLVLGMGSSAYAAAVVAREARSLGRDVVVELASTALLPPPADDLVVVAVSATGGSAEVLQAVEGYRGAGRLIAVTNVEDSPLAARADLVVPLVAGVEASGVSCRTFRHTLVVLAALLRPAVPVAGHASTAAASVPVLLGVREPATLARDAAASADELLGSAASWIDDVDRLLGGPDGTFLLAPVERLSSAQQSALMLREVPRRPAWASETGDWSHVDVYLSKTLDYRALLFAGSVWDGAALDWLSSRAATVVLVGSSPALSADLNLRYRGDDDPAVALLVEPLVAELLAARWHGADPDFAWSRSLS